MNGMVSRTRGESGQAIVFMVFALLTIVGMAALVIDGGRWFQTQRHVQTAADAAALAGAQDLPNTATATSDASTYAGQNYTGLTSTDVSFPTDGGCVADGCIEVHTSAQVPATLAKIYGAIFNNPVTARARARAMVSVPLFMKNVAPVAVKNTRACIVSNPGCFNQTTTMTFDESQVASSTIGLINLTCHSTVSTACGSSSGIGGSQLDDWIEHGYADALPANQWYGVKTGETVGPVKHGFEAMIGIPLLFPVFDQVASSGPSFFYHVIGWAAFVIEPGGVTWTSQNRQLTGHFVTFIATDLASGGPISGASDFGVHTINLIPVPNWPS